MAKYKIGITEAGDAGIDLSWAKKMDTVDGAVVVTKAITSGFIQKVLEYKDKLVVHVTCTGYGGTILEPNVLHPRLQRNAATIWSCAGSPGRRSSSVSTPLSPRRRAWKRP